MMNNNDKKNITLSPAQAAFMYQQLAELEPFFLPDSEVEVIVQKNALKKNFSLMFTLSGGGAHIKSTGVSNNIYDAAIEAKNNLLNHLNFIKSKVLQEDPPNREDHSSRFPLNKRQLH